MYTVQQQQKGEEKREREEIKRRIRWESQASKLFQRDPVEPLLGRLLVLARPRHEFGGTSRRMPIAVAFEAACLSDIVAVLLWCWPAPLVEGRGRLAAPLPVPKAVPLMRLYSFGSCSRKSKLTFPLISAVGVRDRVGCRLPSSR